MIFIVINLENDSMLISAKAKHVLINNAINLSGVEDHLVNNIEIISFSASFENMPVLLILPQFALSKRNSR